MPKEESSQIKKDLAEQYQVMMNLSAWRHFEANILNRIENQAMSDEDNIPLDELSMIRIAELRGRRKAIDKIHTDLDYIVNGLK
jgi:hypothetical protein